MFFLGQNTQAAGTYWNMRNGERIDMELGGQLSGNRNMIYVKAPRAVMLAAGPVLGLNFAVFLPFIWIAMAVSLAGKKIIEGRASAAAGSVSFGWRPIEAYLAGRKRKNDAREKKEDTGSAQQ